MAFNQQKMGEFEQTRDRCEQTEMGFDILRSTRNGLQSISDHTEKGLASQNR